jgi:Family of unknown function (DUF5995)
MRGKDLGRILAGALAAAALAVPAGASAGTLNWATLAPSLAEGYDPDSPNICRKGTIGCVDAVIKEMERRFGPLASTCNHDAVFALTYLRTTEAYRRAVAADPAFFRDTRFVNYEDAVFANLYFTAYDDWAKGRRAQVPAAWRIAFDAADDRAVNGTGSLLLGMSAHVNRDLPFALYSIGLVAPDGTARKADHDRVNDILVKVVEPLLLEAARRFDPSIGTTELQGVQTDDIATFQLLASWREGAWRNAERLAAARTDAEREQVAASIEASAAETGRLLRLQASYLPPVTSTGARDTWCGAHWDDP